ncbi:MAG: DUF1289 domain-containing protein [Pseudomonadales bacterium]
MIKPIPTPCIGVCSTVLGDSVCRGCKRFAHEVIHWNSYTHAQKRAVDDRLQQLLSQIVRTYVEVVDGELLQHQIGVNKIASAEHRNLHCRAYDLLRAGSGQMQRLENFGLRARSDQQHRSATQLKEAIDADFWALSEAYYHRYFRVAERVAERV